jgi:hypothetical protein
LPVELIVSEFPTVYLTTLSDHCSRAVAFVILILAPVLAAVGPAKSARAPFLMIQEKAHVLAPISEGMLPLPAEPIILKRADIFLA